MIGNIKKLLNIASGLAIGSLILWSCESEADRLGEQFFQNGIDNGLFRNMPPCMLGYLSIGSVLSISQTQRVTPFEMTAELEEQLIQASWRAILAD